MLVVTVPEEITESHLANISMFLGGSIEQGKAENWQERVINSLQDLRSFVILNPRRKNWDSSWDNDPTNPQFREQVEWELLGQEEADILLYYFAANTMSPITLLELGLAINTYNNRNYRKIIVYVDPEYQRFGNVVITCERYNVPCFVDYDKVINHIHEVYEKKCDQYWGNAWTW
jgi:hypothetical protein